MGCIWGNFKEMQASVWGGSVSETTLRSEVTQLDSFVKGVVIFSMRAKKSV